MNGSQYIWILNGRKLLYYIPHWDKEKLLPTSLCVFFSDPFLKLRCAIISHIPKGRTFYFPCSSTEGRYVTVFLPGTKKILTLCEVEVFPSDYADGNHVPNLALRGKAFQSSTLANGSASKAIDGRRDSTYYEGFCTHTLEETNPWWRLDLRETHAVTSVKVTNRGDCCAQRLDGAEIRIGNSAENNGNDNPKCASISHIGAGKTVTFYCEGGSVMGRFVNVIIPGPKKALTLCEVEVYAVDPLANVAPNGQATQSSLYANNVHAVNVINGDMTGLCSHTANQSSPWWKLDLLAVHRVRAVTIFNRPDCCPKRLIGAEILIGNSPSTEVTQNPRCGTISSVEGTLTHTFHCGDMEGRYVVVILPGQKRILSLCEVEVYASLADTAPPPPATESMLLNGRNVTVVGERLCWSDALLYCRRHHWDLLSILSREEQSEVEQLLSRGSFLLTDHVWLGLRRQIMGDSWFWMSGEAMDFTKWQYDSAPQRVSHACGAVARGDSFLWKDRPCEEHLNFICHSGGEDGAHRVYFYSSRQDPHT
ncbi:uncharacterized protein [Labrus bergylta]|uniref:uncharacterized protein n=1 Tax=Labrus bergylta TaxID=56723 RepID=UPI0033136C0F